MDRARFLRRQAAVRYLGQRTGSYEQRCARYKAVADELFAARLNDQHLLMDVGAGMCDFDVYLRTDRGWRGRYLAVDASIDGVDLETWRPEVRADYVTAIEVLEHVRQPAVLARQLFEQAASGVVVTTPNGDELTRDLVLETDDTYVSPLGRADLEAFGFENVFSRSLFGAEEDTLIGTWWSSWARPTTTERHRRYATGG